MPRSAISSRIVDEMPGTANGCGSRGLGEPEKTVDSDRIYGFFNEAFLWNIKQPPAMKSFHC